MAHIKSALELALEKAESYGRASKEEMLKEQHFEKGRQLAVRYLKEEEVDLEAELARLPDESQTAAKGGAMALQRGHGRLYSDAARGPAFRLAFCASPLP